MNPIRMLIVDDHPIYAQGLKALLEDEADLNIVGLAADGFAALDLIEALRPDIVVLDVRLPGISGPDLARQIRIRWPELRILALSGFDDDETVCDMIAAGAMGYVLKDAGPEEIARALRLVMAGQSHLTPSVARKVLEQFGRLDDPGRERLEEYDGLSGREVEVLRLIAQGDSNKQIARRLYLSERTIENHVYNIYRKIEVRDRTQAMLYAVRKGLVDFEASDVT